MKTPNKPPKDIRLGPVQSSGDALPVVKLKLYIAYSTPNSVRAEHNLHKALSLMPTDRIKFDLEVIDVFTNAKRAIVDSVIVTPTLIVSKGAGRYTIVGDLSESAQLNELLVG